MTVIGLLRHGPTQWNRDKRIQGTRDIPLDPQSFDPVPWRSLLAVHGPWDTVVSSSLSRAVSTAHLLFPDRNIVRDPRLCEQDWGDWTGRTLRNLRQTAPGLVETQEARGWDFTPPGGESRRQVLARTLDALHDATRAGGRVLIVTHLGVIKTVINHLLGSPFLPDHPVDVAKRALHLLRMDNGILSILQTNVKAS